MGVIGVRIPLPEGHNVAVGVRVVDADILFRIGMEVQCSQGQINIGLRRGNNQEKGEHMDSADDQKERAYIHPMESTPDMLQSRGVKEITYRIITPID